MNNQNKNDTLFLSALKEAVRQYPSYFYLTEALDVIDSMWDMQPHYSMLESLLLEDEATQQFVTSVWSFFRPISLGAVSLAETTRAMHPWQKAIIAQLILHDPIGQDGGIPDFSVEEQPSLER